MIVNRSLPIALYLFVFASQGCATSPPRDADAAIVPSSANQAAAKDGGVTDAESQEPAAGDGGEAAMGGEHDGGALPNEGDAAVPTATVDDSDPCPLQLTVPRAVSSTTTWSCFDKVHTMAAFSVYNGNDHPITIELDVDGTFRDTLTFPVVAGWQPRRLFMPQGVHTYTFRVGGSQPGSFQMAYVYGANVTPVAAAGGRFEFYEEFIPKEVSGAWLVDNFYTDGLGVTIHPPPMQAGEATSMHVDCSAVTHTQLSLTGVVLNSSAGQIDLAVDGSFQETLAFPDGEGPYIQTIDVPSGEHKYSFTARATDGNGPILALQRMVCE